MQSASYLKYLLENDFNIDLLGEYRINNSEELAMGTVVGSNISNIALIFGVSCIGISIKPSKTSFIQFLPFLLGAILLGLSLQDLKITTYESITFVLLFFLFILITYKFKSHEDINSSTEDSGSPIGNTSLLLAVGLTALIGGSHFAVIHAESIAILLNVPQLVIGLTIIAIGTSLPELAATISAITKNKNDMVIGNVIGSNVMIKFVKDRPGHDIRYALDSKKILRTLRWKTKVSFEKGLEKTFLWYLHNNNYYKSISKKDIIKRLGTK